MNQAQKQVLDQGKDKKKRVNCMHCGNIMSATEGECTSCFAQVQGSCYHKDCNKDPRVNHNPVQTDPNKSEY